MHPCQSQSVAEPVPCVRSVCGAPLTGGRCEGCFLSRRRADLSPTTAGDDAAYVALSSLMLHDLPPDTKRQGLAEVYRVLKPGGRFVIADFAPPSNPLWWLLLWPSVLANLRGQRAGIITFWSAVKPRQEGGAT